MYGDYVEVKIKGGAGGANILISPGDFAAFKLYNWKVEKDIKSGKSYVITKIDNVVIHLSWFIAGYPSSSKHECVDHINGNTWDNRLENLRWCTITENNNNNMERRKAALAVY